MKTLYLIRHAKSSWKFPDLDDFDRPLNKRGKRDAPVMGQRLRQQGIQPDLIISSPAKRTRRTAQAVAEAVKYSSSKIQYDKTLYHATSAAMQSVLTKVDDSVGILVFVGHNPGLTDFANQLTSHSIDNVVTTGIVAVTFSAEQWSEVKPDGSGKFLWYDYPKAN